MVGIRVCEIGSSNISINFPTSFTCRGINYNRPRYDQRILKKMVSYAGLIKVWLIQKKCIVTLIDAAHLLRKDRTKT